MLVNVAAIVPFTAWDEITFEEWRRIMSVNLDGVFLTIKAVEKPMREAGYGRIVNIASNVILAGTPEPRPLRGLERRGVVVHPRSCARARQVRHHRQLRRAWADRVRGRARLPARGGLRVRPDAAGDPASRRVSSDIAPAVAFLASEEAGWVTGQMIVADGGHTHN